ncbi:MAG TPA: ATP-binding cassette domain-containing protein [Thermoanaerobaculia bacterium]|nr:ATP-binding cassette domain-containing protein [Thermoanaerobaculia bacterium]
MLDVSLHAVCYTYPDSRFALRDIDLVFAKSTHTAIAGPAGCGSTTLLRLISGDLRPDSGEVRIGTRAVNRLRRSRRPLWLAGSEPDFPGRWSVRHALVAAVRQRTLDRVDRQHEYALALSKWQLEAVADRRVSRLSQSERTLVHLAAIELRRPGILLADRLFAGINPALHRWAAGEFFRTLRVIGTTVISAPASTLELGWADRVAIVDRGTVVQAGRPAQVFASPLDEAAAVATGDVNFVPLAIRGTTAESLIGAWEMSEPPFQGTGVALARPDAFSIAVRGEESDLIFSVEEATFEEGRWSATGILSGGFLLRVTLPGSVPVEKGKLLPLRYDPSRFVLIPREMELPQRSAPTDVVPPLRETR